MTLSRRCFDVVSAPATLARHRSGTSWMSAFAGVVGGGPRVVVSTAAFHARVRGSVPGLGGLKETKMFLTHPRVKLSIVGSLRDREVACSASDLQDSNFESCVWGTVSSHSSHHPQDVLLAQFSLYVHKGGLKPDSFHFLLGWWVDSWLLATSTPGMCETLGYCWFDAGPTSKTTALYRPSIGYASRTCWVISSRQTRGVGPVLLWCWVVVAEVGPHWTSIGSTSRVWWFTCYFHVNNITAVAQLLANAGLIRPVRSVWSRIYNNHNYIFLVWCIYRHNLWQAYHVTLFLLV